jgi:hypothetical protein
MKQAKTVEERQAQTQELVKVAELAMKAMPRSRPVNGF